MEEKTGRRFYELPPHIKPCSKIIEETRVALRESGRRFGSSDSLSSSLSSPGRSLMNRSNSYQSVDEMDICDGSERRENGLFGGIRPVNTQRPFTPRNAGFWGSSAKKRPPSAITLSRLSLEDFEEKRPKSRMKLKSFSPSPSHQGSVLHNSVSFDSSANHPILATRNFFNSQDGEKYLRKEIEKGRLKIKSLSLTNSKAMTSDTQGLNVNDEKMRKIDHHSDQPEFDGDGDNSFVGSLKSKKLNSVMESLDAYTNNSDKCSKVDLISLLKEIRRDLDAIDLLEKKQLLKLIFKLVEKNQNDDDILFWSSFLLLHCKVSGNNLTTVFKLIFRASRSMEYLNTIKNTEYLYIFMESLALICPLTQTDSMIYGYGTLKFICTEIPVLHKALELNLIPIMTVHLKLLNIEVLKMEKVPEKLFNACFQLTSIFRNVVGEEKSISGVIENGSLDELCDSFQWTIEDIDLVSNTVRILSVVSSYDSCCNVIMGNKLFHLAVVKIFQEWFNKDDVVVRLTYCLGNLLARDEEFRVKLFEEDAFEMILKIIDIYLDKDTPISQDILIKSIRVIANWSLSPMIGTEICDNVKLEEIFKRILKSNASEELIICVISTLNNTSFYKNYRVDDNLSIEMVESLCPYLSHKNMDIRNETMKVLGNLTRSFLVRECSNKYVQTMLSSLKEFENEELVYSTIGVFINIIVNEKTRHEFIQNDGLEILMDLMMKKEDVVLSLMICQTLWNLILSGDGSDNSENDQSVGYGIRNEQKLELLKILKHKLANNLSGNGSYASDDMTEFQNNFQMVAKNLEERLMIN